MIFAYHDQTKHSYFSVREGSHRLDWSLQPTPYKRYERTLKRFAFDLEDDEDRFLYHIGGINAQKHYPEVSYYLRMNPAAGALYPNELYVQIRGVAGKPDGIYHYEAFSSALRLLYPLHEDEGLEALVGERRPIKGYLFLLSMVPWRSAWKYRLRAFRYCLLDGGHLLGAIEMAALLKPHATRICYKIDHERLNRHFGFEQQEYMLSAAVVGVPMREAAQPKVPVHPLPSADATDTFMPTPEIVAAYRESLKQQACKRQLRAPSFDFVPSRLQEAIFRRRSTRAFAPEAISKGQLHYLESILAQPILSDCDEEVSVYVIVNRVLQMPCGIRLHGAYLRYGDFSQQAGYLALEQYHLARDGALAFVMTSRGRHYQALYQKVGLIGQRLYLAATYLGLGCSGIGAYYDDEVCDFLGLDAQEEMVLYMMAIGRELEK